MDKPEIDKDGNGILFSGNAKVTECKEIHGNVFLLETELELERKTQISPLPGQFYLVKSARSNVLFGRPISVYHAERKSDTILRVQFLILQKGEGTVELCHLLKNDLVELSGPLGNSFEKTDGKICLCGGGIGVAPVANFASSLPTKSYDFYASFKSGSYGLENIEPEKLVITTDDGSVGIHGMVTAALTSDTIKKEGYSAIYACGPTPMLAYIQKIAKEAGVKCFLSIEKKMLCGAGACLGCTVRTKEGNHRVCKDGPVFNAEILEFEKPSFTKRNPLPQNIEPDLSVEIAGIKFKNPVIAASGTFGFGQNYRGFFDVSKLGGISSKGLTLEPKGGNFGERVIEVSSGDINSIGLENPGVPHFIQNELPEMLKLDTVSIANLAGHDLESYVKGADLLDKTSVPVIELNISCPNVKAGGMAWGINPEAAFTCVSAVRKATSKTLIVKLSPNAPDLVSVALACIKAGANALSLINTIQAVAIDIESGRPVFDNIKAGLCGPAVKPIALRMVYDVVKAVNSLPKEQQIPVIGLGGISKWQDAVEFIMAGAAAIQVGTTTFSNPKTMLEIIEGLKNFMKSHGYKKIDDFRGIAQQ
ncbi:dihydroorotate dehydrogenase [uncultured Treponema sp.]|uniref:dihydroorotate dehydrogenase n=1 Tax=uncultured Treponema sp. TaxID=162155 RepID=UPI0025E6368B|nr:dihydroorotate dehydrogenase [uncultured Treponema sp.]